jgi:hypothetical protein
MRFEPIGNCGGGFLGGRCLVPFARLENLGLGILRSNRMTKVLSVMGAPVLTTLPTAELVEPCTDFDILSKLRWSRRNTLVLRYSPCNFLTRSGTLAQRTQTQKSFEGAPLPAVFPKSAAPFGTC